MVSLYRVTLPVASLERAVAFYQHVFQTTGELVSPTRHYFNCGGTILVCWHFEEEGPPPPSGWQPYDFQFLYFATDDLYGAYQRVREAGGDVRGEIQVMGWGERLFYASDPFGNALCFVDEQTTYRGG
jgi:predicted enzyme related to lactoylglutathione lyase